MNIAPVVTTAPATSNPAVDQHARKIAKAAHDFEAVLLNTLLGPLEKTFSSLPGKETDAVSDNYHSLGMQALASSLAARGGVGIAAMIVKSLSKRDNAVVAAHEKSLARGASLARPF
jgi:Rod binding domain-containing protein